MRKDPLISVIMSAYNAEEFIEEAVNSILKQTFGDFEFLITDDKSTDRTLEIVRSFQDDRIHVFVNEQNRGLTYNLNSMLSVARGKYIARMDADDVSHKDRFMKQVALLERSPDVFLVCTQTASIGNKKIKITTPADSEDLKAILLFENLITHSSVMFRNSANYYYDIEYKKAQDYELWSRIVNDGHKLAVLNETLTYFRYHDNQISNKCSGEQQKFANQVRIRSLRSLGIMLDDHQQAVYTDFLTNESIHSNAELAVILELLKDIVIKNREMNVYEDSSLKFALNKIYGKLYLISLNNNNRWNREYKKSISEYIGFAYTLRLRTGYLLRNMLKSKR